MKILAIDRELEHLLRIMRAEYQELNSVESTIYAFKELFPMKDQVAERYNLDPDEKDIEIIWKQLEAILQAQIRAIVNYKTDIQIPILPRIEFKIGDVVAHHEHKSIGIVRSNPERGALRTDADGMVDTDQLSIYDATVHTDYHIAPSTRKEKNL